MIVDPDLPRHRKTLKLASRLGVSTGEVCLMLINMWGHCQSRKDDFLGVDPDDVAACCQYLSIPAKKLHTALLTVGWIDSTDHGFVAHGWREMNSEWLRKIYGGQKRAQSARDEKGRLASGGPLASSPPSSQLAGPDSAASRTFPRSSLGAEEWRGEENRTSTSPARERACEGGDEFRTADTQDDLASAKKRMCALLGLDPKRAWSYDAQHALTRIVPIPEDEWLAVEWLHRADPERRPKLRMSPGSLCANWQDEVSKARQHAASTGNDLSATASNSAQKKSAAPPEAWTEFLDTNGYPAAPWESVDASVQREFHAWLSSQTTPEPITS